MLIINYMRKMIEIKHPFVSFQTCAIIYVFIFAVQKREYCQRNLICMNVSNLIVNNKS